MSGPDRSFVAFGLYLGGMGTLLVLAPAVALGLFGFPEAEDFWVRVAGMLVLFLAFYYLQVARGKVVDLYTWTIQARMTVILFFGAFVLAGVAPPVLALFGVFDFAFAFWTWWARRRERAVTTPLHRSACIEASYRDGAAVPR
jgi:hypothetical protein